MASFGNGTAKYKWRPHLPLIGLLAAGLGIRVWGIIMTSQTATSWTPLPDDAYYYFSLGRNLAAGNGPRIDASHFTTGFQPLWGGLVTLIFALTPSDPLAISLIQFVGALFDIGTGWLLVALGKELSGSKKIGLLMALWWLISPQAIADSLNGLETSVAIFTVVAVFYSLKWLLNGFSPRFGLVVGFIYGLAFLARVDALVLLGAVGASWMVIKARAGNFSRGQPGTLIKPGAALVLGIGLVLLPWVWFTQLYGKPVIPESGSAVRVITLVSYGLPADTPVESLQHQPALFLNFYGQQILEFTAAWARWSTVLLPPGLWLYTVSAPWLHLLIPLVIAICGGIGLAVLTLRFGSDQQKIAALVWILYAGGMTLAYSVIILGPWFYRRYGVSVGLMFSLLMLTLVYRAGWGRSQVKNRYLEWVKKSIGKIILAYGIFITATIIVLYGFGLYRWLIYGPAVVPDDGFYQTVQWLNKNISPSDRVGVFQSGLISYYAQPLVFNLDGKVNSEVRSTLTNGQMWAYMCREHIDYVADWPSVIDSFLVKGSGWQDDFLIPLHQIRTHSEGIVDIYQVNRQKCPPK